MPARHPLLGALALLVLLSACGGQTAAAPAAPPAPPRPVPVATPAPANAGLALLAAMRRRLASCRGFETEMTSRGEGTWDDGEDKGVRRTNRNRAHLEWTRPHRLHGKMLEAPFALMVGGTMDTTDGQTLTLRPSGLLSVVAMEVQATDVKLRNSRNHTFKDSHPAAQFTRLTGPSAVWRVAETRSEALTVEITGVRRLDAGIEREILMLSPGDLAVRSLTMFEAGRPVVSNTFKGFRWR